MSTLELRFKQMDIVLLYLRNINDMDSSPVTTIFVLYLILRKYCSGLIIIIITILELELIERKILITENLKKIAITVDGIKTSSTLIWRGLLTILVHG